MALIDDISIVIRNERPENVTAQQIKTRVSAALWQLLDDNWNERVYMSNAKAWVRVRDLEDAFAFLIGERKPQ